MSDLAVDVAMKLTILFITIALSVGLFKVLQKNISFLRVVHQGYQVQLDGVYTKVYAFKIMTVLLSGVFQLVFFSLFFVICCWFGLLVLIALCYLVEFADFLLF